MKARRLTLVDPLTDAMAAEARRERERAAGRTFVTGAVVLALLAGGLVVAYRLGRVDERAARDAADRAPVAGDGRTP